MSEAENRATVERLRKAISERDLEAFFAQFHDDLVMEYPQSGERIVGLDNLRSVYSAFPALPSVKLDRIRAAGDLVVAEGSADYGDGAVYQTVFIWELRDGLITHEAAYWPQPFPPAQWRAAWVEQMGA